MQSKLRAFRFVIGVAALACLAFVSISAQAATYYVRADGGTAARCNGTANAPASAAPNCAWSAPTIPLPVGTNEYGGSFGKALIRSGDTLVIGSGSYMIGQGAPGTPGSLCTGTGQTWTCSIASIPSGIDAAHPTVIQGNCSAPPELWGTQRINGVFWLMNVHDIKISCLNLTDHSACIYAYAPSSGTNGITSCNYKTYPYGTYAMNGIEAVNVTNLTLDNVNIHGFAAYGILAGQLHGNTVMNNVTLRANGWAGWNGDISGLGYSSSSNDGDLTFNNLNVSWNGCSEPYPLTTVLGCWGQANGGYGDGMGTAATGGNWTFNNATFSQNSQDGLDLLYHLLGGKVTINGGNFTGSIGNQIKVAGNSLIQNAVINGYCNNFAQFPVGGASGNNDDNCRAMGTAVVMTQNAPSQTSEIRYSTITGDGDTLLIGKGDQDRNGNQYTPSSSNVWTYENNIFLGQASAARSGYLTALDWYSDGTFGGTVKYANNIVWNVRYNACPAVSICKDPQLVNETLAGFFQDPLPSSPAINNANSAYTVPVDYYGTPRPLSGGYDIGAVEYRGQAWLGGDAPPVPSTGGTKPSSGAPVQQPDAPVARLPDGAQLGSNVGSPVPPSERRLAPFGDQRFRAVNPRDARIVRAEWPQGVTPGIPSEGVATAPIVAPAVPPRAAEVAKPAAEAAKTQQLAYRAYWVSLVGWFQDFYRRLAVR